MNCLLQLFIASAMAAKLLSNILKLVKSIAAFTVEVAFKNKPNEIAPSNIFFFVD